MQRGAVELRAGEVRPREVRPGEVVIEDSASKLRVVEVDCCQVLIGQGPQADEGQDGLDIGSRMRWRRIRCANGGVVAGMGAKYGDDGGLVAR